jgi:hypothetical protein
MPRTAVLSSVKPLGFCLHMAASSLWAFGALVFCQAFGFLSPYGCVKAGGAMRGEALKKLVESVPHVSQMQLARIAHMDPVHLSKMLHGERPVHDRTLARLKFAVQRLRCGESEGLAQTNALYRALVVMCAQRMGRDPATVQATDTRASRNFNKDWQDNVMCHSMARYLMCEVFALRQVDLARSLGVTKQAMQQNIATVARREEDDASFAGILAELSRQLMGE